MFSSNGTLISASAAPHCGDDKKDVNACNYSRTARIRHGCQDSTVTSATEGSTHTQKNNNNNNNPSEVFILISATACEMDFFFFWGGGRGVSY